jgi:hypothetical protein
MRDKDRDMSDTDRGSSTERDWSGNIGSDSSRHDPDDRMRNQESTDDLTDMDEDEEDLQERQREGNLGNERVRQSER